jgi:hypothetical protein
MTPLTIIWAACAVGLAFWVGKLLARNAHLSKNEQLAREFMREAMAGRDEAYRELCELRVGYTELMAERDAAVGELMALGVDVRVGVSVKERWN